MNQAMPASTGTFAASSAPPGTPLLAREDPAATIAWREGRAVSGAEFLADVLALADRLPAEGPMLNLHTDRYRFAVGLSAAALRGHMNLLPPNILPATLERLLGPHPRLYVFGGEAAAAALPNGVAQVGWPAHADGASRAFSMPRVADSVDAVCLLTSGSTGESQPHRRGWPALAASVRAEASRLAELVGRPSLDGFALVATVPPQHSYGLESSVMLALAGGAALDDGRPFYPADIAEALARVPRPRALVTTPFHLRTLLRAQVELPTADLVLCATAPLSSALAAEAERALKAPLVEIYGCTEAGQVAARRTVETDIWTTLEGLRVQPAGRSGDDACGFVVEGACLSAPVPLADRLERLDASRFRLLGRTNDLVRVAGKRNSLAHLNHHLNAIEGVVDGAFWVPDDDPGGAARPIAFVVAPTLDAARVVAALRGRIEAAFVPRRVVLLPALPREATGKLTSAAMRRLAGEEAA